MSLEVHSLASGSSGNVMLVRGRHGDLLLDCGMARSFVENELASAGLDLKRLKAVVLTHEHTDHSRGALAVARRYRVPIVASAGTLAAVTAGVDIATCTLQPLAAVVIDEFSLVGHPVTHDAREPFALAVTAGKIRVCYAVDLGEPDESLLQACSGASLVVLESNHDLKRLMRGPYGPDLKDRILGRRGHLSNQDAARIITQVSEGDRPTQFWLAHLSAVNNTPRTALRAATTALRSTGKSHCAVDVALRDRPSLRWSSDCHWWQPRLSMDW